MRQVSNLYKALSDQNRLRILMMLKDKPMCVCEIVNVLQLANSTVSKHLSILRNVDLIMDEKDGRWVNYRLAQSDESDLIDNVMSQLNSLFIGDETINKDRQAVREADRHQICAS
ncbi:MAG: metalloregulator ArsR/SmtB family transcription factor [Candidatus Marinimicrobia bacterium]|nr:metalloregulator ArsR/SmtB family transcription factor [Candidatus Neomarinimicrobiota bacterium]